MNDIVIQSFDDFEWDDSFKERIYTDEDFKKDPKLYYKLMVEWLNTLPIEKRVEFHLQYGKPGTIKTTRENGCFTYYKELSFGDIYVKDVTATEKMPDGSYFKEITFLLKTLE